MAVGVERIRVLGRVYAETRRQTRAVARAALHATIDTFRRARHRIILTFGDHRNARVVAVVVHATRLLVARRRVIRSRLRRERRARDDARLSLIIHRVTDVRHKRTACDLLREASPRDASSRRRSSPLATEHLRFSPDRHRPRARERRRDDDRRNHSLRSSVPSPSFIVRSRHRRRQSRVSSFDSISIRRKFSTPSFLASSVELNSIVASSVELQFRASLANTLPAFRASKSRRRVDRSNEGLATPITRIHDES